MMTSREPICLGQGFDLLAKECRKCMLASFCKQRTESRKFNVQPPKPVEPVSNEIPEMEEIAPFEYLLGLLKNKFDLKEEETDTVRSLVFRKDNKPIAQISISIVTGRIRILTRTFERILDSEEAVENIAMAEEISRKMFAK